PVRHGRRGGRAVPSRRSRRRLPPEGALNSPGGLRLTDLRLHPWNTGFEWRSTSASPETLTPEQRDQFDRDGYVVLEHVLPLPLVDALREEIDGFEARTESYLRGRDDERLFIAEAGAITFTTHLVTRSERLRYFAAHALFA